MPLMYVDVNSKDRRTLRRLQKFAHMSKVGWGIGVGQQWGANNITKAPFFLCHISCCVQLPRFNTAAPHFPHTRCVLAASVFALSFWAKLEYLSLWCALLNSAPFAVLLIEPRLPRPCPPPPPPFRCSASGQGCRSGQW